MKILVAGGAGFIGSHVCDVLLDRGHRVLCLDDLSKGRLENIRHHLDHPHFAFHQIDILDRDRLFATVPEADGIIHLVAQKIPRYGGAVPMLKLNSQGTVNILDLAQACAAKVVLGSTSDVYGKSDDLPFREDGDLRLGPSTSRRWAYAVSKLFDEHLFYGYADEKNLRITILRFFGTYGERQYLNWWGGPQGVFLESIFSDRPITIHGDGTQTRCFVYVKDAAEAAVRALETPAADGEIINIGTPEEVGILELARLIHGLAGVSTPLRTEFVPYETFSKNYEDVMRRVPSSEKMERILGYTPPTDLRRGLLRLIDWYRDRILHQR